MTVSGANCGSALGAGLRRPTCWEYFGFDGPTHRDNLEQARRDRIMYSLVYEPDYAAEQYRACLAQLDGDASMKEYHG